MITWVYTRKGRYLQRGQLQHGRVSSFRRLSSPSWDDDSEFCPAKISPVIARTKFRNPGPTRPKEARSSNLKAV